MTENKFKSSIQKMSTLWRIVLLCDDAVLSQQQVEPTSQRATCLPANQNQAFFNVPPSHPQADLALLGFRGGAASDRAGFCLRCDFFRSRWRWRWRRGRGGLFTVLRGKQVNTMGWTVSMSRGRFKCAVWRKSKSHRATFQPARGSALSEGICSQC